MNERIQQLAEQCRIETYGVNGELLTFGFDEEKFAELIVRECIWALWTEECRSSDLALEEFEKNSKKILSILETKNE